MPKRIAHQGEGTLSKSRPGWLTETILAALLPKDGPVHIRVILDRVSRMIPEDKSISPISVRARLHQMKQEGLVVRGPRIGLWENSHAKRIEQINLRKE